MNQFVKYALYVLFFGPVLVISAIIAYFVADKVVQWTTDKRIHEHIQTRFPAFTAKVQQWCQSAVGYSKVTLQLLASDAYVSNKRMLKAIGYSKNATQEPVTVTEEMISPEEALQLGFDIAAACVQELDYMTMAA